MQMMDPEQYRLNMHTYSDDRLKEMLLAPSLYHDDAMLAAVWEAEKRGLLFRGLDKLKEKYEGLYEAAMRLKSEEEEAEFMAAQARDAAMPELFSPMTIFWFSLFFNTLLGGFMLAYNLGKVNKKARLQVYAFSVFFALSSVLIVSLFQVGGMFPFLYNLAGAFALRDFFWRRSVPANFAFRVKSAKIPFLIGVGYTLLLFALLYFYGDLWAIGS
ncbi:MAG: hypothetical protein CSA95_03890 [Bacteroidetes bacterium]|nr:MAG: hypothetical protein CSA95_03890 [Bacteroidota bacterium]